MSTDGERGDGRFERVRAILREAAHDKASAYAGLALWNYSRDELIEARLEGVRLIAPASAESGSCCAHRGTAASGEESRSARSGLVRGLWGAGPFDGSQFPRLPWGADAVPDEHVRFIAEWIDDGCPGGDGDAASFDLAPEAAAPIAIQVTGRARVHAESFQDATDYAYRPGELKQRMNIDCMDERQLEKLRAAFRELYELNKWPEDRRNYNNLALVHQNHCQHGWERFLTWHRVYLYEFEQALQDVVPDVTMPYWDFAMPQYRPEKPETGWIIPKSMQAYLTEDSLRYLADHGIETKGLEALVRKPGDLDPAFPSPSKFFEAVGKIIDEKYIHGAYRNRFVDALLEANALWYPLRYPGEYKGGQPVNHALHRHYPTADDIAQILDLRTFRDFGGGSLYNDAFGFLDQNPHNTMHIWTGGQNPYKGAKPAPEQGAVPAPRDRNRFVQVAGRKFHSREDMYAQPELGDMFSNLTASYDPVFWPIHANIDRLWWEWQQRHPESKPVDLDAVLTPWSYTARDTLDMHRFGYEYVKSACVIPVGTDAPFGRFVSRRIEVADTVRGAFRQAEVRLHRVPQLVRSCFVRLFLNAPDADATTPIDDDRYAGYLAIFGHGACYGGPGHCDVPPLRRREYDLRGRDHNTPRNHRIDVTSCARRRFAAGETSLQITVVVIGVDYLEEPELLRLEGISLNFLD